MENEQWDVPLGVEVSSGSLVRFPSMRIEFKLFIAELLQIKNKAA
jgi:hypothetical protein